MVGNEAVVRAVRDVTRPVQLVLSDGRQAAADGGAVTLGAGGLEAGCLPLVGYAPALRPECLGSADFRAAHGLRYAYVAGAMANGIASEAMVEAMSASGMIGFFGSAGLELDRIEAAIDRIQRNVGDGCYGFNLIHSPSEPQMESAVVDLYLRRGVRLVSASAYLDLTLPLVRFRLSGIRAGADGGVVTPNRVIAKVSRVEVARKFFSPAPLEMIERLVSDGVLTREQAELAGRVPVAEDLTAEADSGGHTDNRPAIALIPTMIALAEEMTEAHGFAKPLRVGAAGGIATPQSAAAAFALGAAYVLTGSINQACVEAGTSETVREMLAEAGQADMTMAPAADMFEMGVKVQVLKWGTMFAVRGRKLYDLYRSCASLEDLPANQRAVLERDYFRCSLAEAWARTCAFFAERDPKQIERAERDAKHKMSLVFRSYLGRSSDWANRGEPSRKSDYQIWCGPAMGAFNEWTRGSFLAKPAARDVVTVAVNLLVGAADMTRVGWLRVGGVSLPRDAYRVRPRPVEELKRMLADEAA